MNSNAAFFLAKNGNVSGPFNSKEIESLRASGQIADYTWIKQGEDGQWSPIDAPPPSNAHHNEAPAVAASSVRLQPPVVKKIAPVQQVAPDSYRVILFDHKNAISGWLLSAHENGCEIRSDQNGSDPLFVQKSTACLSLHNPKSGDSLKVNVRLSAVQRQDGSWNYRLRWKPLAALEELLQVS